MKSKILTFMVAGIFPFMTFAAKLKVGDAKPTLKAEIAQMEATDGKKYTIADVKGKNGTLVIFTCNHCPYAVKWEKRIAKIGNEALKKGFGVIAINPNDPEANPMDNMDGMKKRAKELGLKFPYAMDSTSMIAKAYGAQKTPEIFLFDKDSKLVYMGAVDDNYEAKEVKENWLADAIEKVAAGKTSEIKESATKAVGCSIKWRKNAS